MNQKKQTHFAKNKKGELIEAIKGMIVDSSLYCLGCEEEVGAYAINTKVQRTHFRHLKNIGGNGGCGDSESYIHNLSKEKFAENYRNVSIFNLYREITLTCIQAKHPSCKSITPEVLNLKEIYPYIKVEKRDGSFIPDCLLYNDKNEKIYIEIKYTSSISDAKRDSGIPIIEIEIQKELDIDEVIRDNAIKENDRRIKLFNIKSIPTNSIYDCKGICLEEVRIKREKIEKERLQELEKIKKERLQKVQEANEKYRKNKDNRPIVEKEKYKAPNPKKREKIIGTQSVQLLKEKNCLKCKTMHYMNVGRIIINEKYEILSQDKEPFTDERKFSDKFSIATRVAKGKTNAYYCPNCKEWIANYRFLGYKGRKIHEDEEIIIGQIGLF